MLRWEGPATAGAEGRRSALCLWFWAASWRGRGRAAFLRPKGAAALRIQQALNCWLGLLKVVCKVESLIFVLLHPLLEPLGWPFDHLSRLRVVDGTNTWTDGVKLHFNNISR